MQQNNTMEARTPGIASAGLGVLVAVFAVNYMDRQILAILIEPIRHDLGLTDAQAGLLYGLAFAVFFSALGIPLARWADRSDRVRLIVGCVAVFGLMTAICGAAAGFVHLLLARIGVATGEAGTHPASQSLIADLYPLERRSTAMSVYSLGPHIGIVLGLILGGLSAQWLGWRSAFVLAGGVSLLVGVVAALVLRDPRSFHTRNAAVPVPATAMIGELWRYQSIRHLFIGATAISICVSALMGWLPSFLVRSHGLSTATTGLLLAVVLGVFGGAGTIASGLIADRLGTRNPAARLQTVAVGMLICVPAWAAAFGTLQLPIAMTGLVFGGALIAFHLGPTYAMVQSLAAPDGRALAASLLLFVANLVGIGAGPLVVGWISDTLAVQQGTESLRLALCLVLPIYLWGAAHYFLASRTIANDLAQAAVIDWKSARAAPGPQMA